jgi:hypothetical protein
MEVRHGHRLKNQDNMQMSEMEFLRQVAGYTGMECKRNVEIRKELKMAIKVAENKNIKNG